MKITASYTEGIFVPGATVKETVTLTAVVTYPSLPADLSIARKFLDVESAMNLEIISNCWAAGIDPNAQAVPPATGYNAHLQLKFEGVPGLPAVVSPPAYNWIDHPVAVNAIIQAAYINALAKLASFGPVPGP